MTDFDYDCLQRKRLARQAQYKKSGSKSKKCTLPHEYLTQKQLRERNGELMTYNFSQPMSWKEFKSMPTSLQEEYISRLISQYDVNMVALLQLFGINRATLMRHMQANNMSFSFQKGHRMSACNKEKWNSFLCPDDKDEPTDMSREDQGCQDSDFAQSDKSQKMEMSQVSLRFSGLLDVSMIANSLRMILGDDWSGDVQIVCKSLYSGINLC